MLNCKAISEYLQSASDYSVIYILPFECNSAFFIGTEIYPADQLTRNLYLYALWMSIWWHISYTLDILNIGWSAITLNTIPKTLSVEHKYKHRKIDHIKEVIATIRSILRLDYAYNFIVVKI